MLLLVADLQLRNPAVPLLGLECFEKAQQIPVSGTLVILNRGIFGTSEIREMMYRWLPFLVFWKSRLILRARDQACWKLKQNVRAIERIEWPYAWRSISGLESCSYARRMAIKLISFTKAQLLPFPHPLAYTYPDTPSPPCRKPSAVSAGDSLEVHCIEGSAVGEASTATLLLGTQTRP